MNRPTNAALKLAGIALTLSCLSAGLTGCGGSDSDGGSKADDPKSDSTTGTKGASTEGFCDKFTEFYSALAGGDPSDVSTTIKNIKSWVGEMDDYGTPSEMSDEARAGFAVLIGMFRSVDDDATLKDIQELGLDASPADSKKAEAFGAWTTENCPSPSLPSPSAS